VSGDLEPIPVGRVSGRELLYEDGIVRGISIPCVGHGREVTLSVMSDETGELHFGVPSPDERMQVSLMGGDTVSCKVSSGDDEVSCRIGASALGWLLAMREGGVRPVCEVGSDECGAITPDRVVACVAFERNGERVVAVRDAGDGESMTLLRDGGSHGTKVSVLEVFGAVVDMSWSMVMRGGWSPAMVGGWRDSDGDCAICEAARLCSLRIGITETGWEDHVRAVSTEGLDVPGFFGPGTASDGSGVTVIDRSRTGNVDNANRVVLRDEGITFDGRSVLREVVLASTFVGVDGVGRVPCELVMDGHYSTSGETWDGDVSAMALEDRPGMRGVSRRVFDPGMDECHCTVLRTEVDGGAVLYDVSPVGDLDGLPDVWILYGPGGLTMVTEVSGMRLACDAAYAAHDMGEFVGRRIRHSAHSVTRSDVSEVNADFIENDVLVGLMRSSAGEIRYSDREWIEGENKSMREWRGMRRRTQDGDT
jgi:hypothetical protein